MKKVRTYKVKKRERYIKVRKRKRYRRVPREERVDKFGSYPSEEIHVPAPSQTQIEDRHTPKAVLHSGVPEILFLIAFPSIVAGIILWYSETFGLAQRTFLPYFIILGGVTCGLAVVLWYLRKKKKLEIEHLERSSDFDTTEDARR